MFTEFAPTRQPFHGKTSKIKKHSTIKACSQFRITSEMSAVIQTHKSFNRTLFIRTKTQYANLRFVVVVVVVVVFVVVVVVVVVVVANLQIIRKVGQKYNMQICKNTRKFADCFCPNK